MNTFKLIFMFLPIAYAWLGWLFYNNAAEVLGVIMILLSCLFGLLAFMLTVTESQKRTNCNNSNRC